MLGSFTLFDISANICVLQTHYPLWSRCFNHFKPFKVYRGEGSTLTIFAACLRTMKRNIFAACQQLLPFKSIYSIFLELCWPNISQQCFFSIRPCTSPAFTGFGWPPCTEIERTACFGFKPTQSIPKWNFAVWSTVVGLQKGPFHIAKAAIALLHTKGSLEKLHSHYFLPCSEKTELDPCLVQHFLLLQLNELIWDYYSVHLRGRELQDLCRIPLYYIFNIFHILSWGGIKVDCRPVFVGCRML